MYNQYTIISDAWIASMPSLVDQRLSKKLFIELYNQYNDSNRTYHNLNHLRQMIQQIYNEPQFNPVLVLATLYHDYYIGKQHFGDEVLSAMKAEQDLLSLGFSKSFCNEVSELILSTQHHSVDLNVLDNVVLLKFLDMDLSILSSDNKAYQQYINDIKQECMIIYQLTDTQYSLLRLQWIEKICKRSKLFYTKSHIDIDKAINNLKYEYEQLCKQVNTI